MRDSSAASLANTDKIGQPLFLLNPNILEQDQFIFLFLWDVHAFGLRCARFWGMKLVDFQGYYGALLVIISDYSRVK